MGYSMRLSYSITDDTISFGDDDPDTIMDSLNRFVDGGFIAGQNITVVDSTSNDGTYLVDTVSASTFVLDAGESLTIEAAGTYLTIGSVNFDFSPRIDSGYAIPEVRDRRIYEDCPNGNLIINEISEHGRWEIPLNNIASADFYKVETWWRNMLKLTFTPDLTAPGTVYYVRIVNEDCPLDMMGGTGWATKYEGMLILEKVPALS